LNLIENSKVVGTYLKESLQRIPQITQVSGRGLYIGFNLPNASKIVHELYQRRIVVGIGSNDTVRVKPPIIVTK
jgi:acetylornithine/succinyldiaminopimelate/putrescine aminotransferase